MRTLAPLVLLPLLLLVGCAHVAPLNVESPYRDPRTLKEGEILHLATGRLLTEAELLDYVARFPVVYVGEAHDNADDHEVQLKLLKGLHERFPGKVAVGLEMLKRPYQAEVDRFVRGEMDEKDFQRLWSKNWGDFFYYRDIVLFARDNRIPLVALNIGDDLKKAFREKGAAELDPELAKQVPELDMEDPYHRAVMEAMMGGHAKGSGDPEVFYRVQVLWDEAMAQAAADYLKSPEGKDRRLLVFAGGNHVRHGIGIPRRVFRRVPVPFAIVETYLNPTEEQIPEEKQMSVEMPELPMPSANFYWSVGYRDLADQRVKLGIMMEAVEGKGVKVAGVLPESAAAAAGLKEGDFVVSMDGTEVKELFDVTYQVGLKKPGDAGTVEVLRGEERLTLPVTYSVPKHE